jgi:hypothetical protein
MNHWLAQLILAARNRDDRDGGWMQILVFVILAVFYAVGSIVKAKANKTAPKKKERIPRKPVRKPPESTKELQMLKQLFGLSEEAESSQPAPSQAAKPQVRPAGRKVTRPQPAARRKSPAEAKMEKVSGRAAKTAVATGVPHTGYLSEILSDYDDPGKLRRAILHYEILGKPMSLRDPSEHIKGF